MVVRAAGLERRVAEVAPEHGEHPQLMSLMEQLGHLLDLPVRLLRSEVDGGADPHRAHVERLLHVRETDLIVGVGVRQEFVVVELQDEGNPVRVAARDRSQDAERRCDGVAASLDRQPDDVLGIEVIGVRRERRAGGVFDALIDRQDRDVPGAGQPPVIEQRLQAGEHARGPVRRRHAAVDEVRPGEVQPRCRDRLAPVLQQGGVIAQNVDDPVCFRGGPLHYPCSHSLLRLVGGCGSDGVPVTVNRKASRRQSRGWRRARPTATPPACPRPGSTGR